MALEAEDAATATRHFDLIREAYLSATFSIDTGEFTPAERYHAIYDRFRAGDFTDWDANVTDPFADTVG